MYYFPSVTNESAYLRNNLYLAFLFDQSGQDPCLSSSLVPYVWGVVAGWQRILFWAFKTFWSGGLLSVMFRGCLNGQTFQDQMFKFHVWVGVDFICIGSSLNFEVSTCISYQPHISAWAFCVGNLVIGTPLPFFMKKIEYIIYQVKKARSK